MSLDPLAFGGFSVIPTGTATAAAGGGGTAGTIGPEVGLQMGPPAPSIPHATADPATSHLTAPSAASPTSPTTTTTMRMTTPTDPGISWSASGSGSGFGYTMPIYTNVKTTGTPSIDQYGAAPPILSTSHLSNRSVVTMARLEVPKMVC